MIPTLSEEGWALLGVLHRAHHGGPKAPEGFSTAYEELKQHGLAAQTTPDKIVITVAGEVALRRRLFSDI